MSAKPNDLVVLMSASERVVLQKGWIKYSDGADAVLVFVHGFLSSAVGCWATKNGNSWPDLVKSDANFKNCAIYVAEYYTAPNSGEYDIAHSADELFDQLNFESSDKFRAVMTFANIIFVCHSLGGILVRRIVENQKHLFMEKAVGLYLVSSPSGGSEYARAFEAVGRIYKNKIVEQLKTGGAVLSDLDSRFKDLIYKKTIPRLVGAEISENYGPFWIKWLPIRTSPIVAKDSSSRYFGAAKVAPESDHFSIAKPGTVESFVYRDFLRFFCQYFKPVMILGSSEGGVKIEGACQVAPVNSRVLFDIYKIDCKGYYLCRDVDDSFEEMLKYSSVWLYGPSGCGKTSMARYSILSSDQPAAPHIDLGLAYVTGKIEDCYDAIVATYRTHGLTDMDRASYSFADVASMLACAHSSQSIVRILLDEIPLSDADGVVITDFLLNLIVKVNTLSSVSIRFIICSINPPRKDLITDKFQESLRVFALKTWTEKELIDLIALIEDSVNFRFGGAVFGRRLASLEGCSPRMIKNFFRRLLGLGELSQDSIERTFAEFEYYGFGNE